MGQGVTTGLRHGWEMNANYETAGTWSIPKSTSTGAQGTGGSLSMQGGGFLDYRKAGASAREIIVKAAAEKWSVDSVGLVTA